MEEVLGSGDLASLFDVPEYQEQQELLSFPVPAVDVDSPVELPVAHVLVDAPGAQWAPIYDYEVPAHLEHKVTIGCAVRVPYAHARVEGFVVGRSASSSHAYALKPIDSVISPLSVLSENILQECEELAHYYVAPLSDVLRFAVPQRHARAEREVMALPARKLPVYSQIVDDGAWASYTGGKELIDQVRHARSVRAAVTMAPRHSYAELIAPLIRVQLEQGRSSLVIGPTQRMADSVHADLTNVFTQDVPSLITPDRTHEERYRAFLGAREGRTRIIVGTRAAAFAPLQHLGLVAVLDRSHSAHREVRSPQIHSACVAAVRARTEGASLIFLDRGPVLDDVGNHCAHITVAPDIRRQLRPQIVLAQDVRYEGAPWARMPDSVFSTLRAGLHRGHVLILVPHSGYIPIVACARCGERAVCLECGGALGVPQPDAPPTCAICAASVNAWSCSKCGFRAYKARRVGSARTAQEIGRAFPHVPIVVARDSMSISTERTRHSIIICTPSDVPNLSTHFSCAVILDTGYLLRSQHLDGDERLLRIVAHVASLVDARSDDGTVLIVGDIPPQLESSLRTLEYSAWSTDVLEERASLHLPPSSQWIELQGSWHCLRTFLGIVRGLAISGIERANFGLNSEKDDNSIGSSQTEHVPTASSQTPIDALIEGGVHCIIPHTTILGPAPQRDGTALIHLRCDHVHAPWLRALLRKALGQAALRKDLSAPRITVDPQL